MVKRAFLGQFQDLDAFDRVITEIGIPNKINQVSRGLLSSQLIAVNLGPLQLLQIDFNQAMVIRGSKPPGYFLFAMTIAQGGAMLKSHGRAMEKDCPYGGVVLTMIFICQPPNSSNLL